MTETALKKAAKIDEQITEVRRRFNVEMVELTRRFNAEMEELRRRFNGQILELNFQKEKILRDDAFARIMLGKVPMNEGKGTSKGPKLIDEGSSQEPKSIDEGSSSKGPKSIDEGISAKGVKRPLSNSSSLPIESGQVKKPRHSFATISDLLKKDEDDDK